MKKALVTCGCSPMGMYMCKRLFALGYYVVCLDDMKHESCLYPEQWPSDVNISAERNFVFMYIDYDEFFSNDVEYFGKNPKWDIVMHFTSAYDMTPENRVMLDVRFFYWLNDLVFAPESIVYLSSYKIYDNLHNVVLKEEMVKIYENDVETNTDIATALLLGEKFVAWLRDNKGMNIGIYRPFELPPQTITDCIISTMEELVLDNGVLNICNSVTDKGDTSLCKSYGWEYKEV